MIIIEPIYTLIDSKEFAYLYENVDRVNIAYLYLFSWDDVPGNNTEIIKFLKEDLKINWVENATINKSSNNKTINVTDKTNSSHIITLELNKEKNMVTLEITSGKNNYTLKEENGKLNIYVYLIEQDDFCNLNTIKIKDTIDACKIECYLIEFGVGYIIAEKQDDNLPYNKIKKDIENAIESFKKKLFENLIQEIKGEGNTNLHENFIKHFENEEKKLKLKSALYGVSFPLLRREDIHAKYIIKRLSRNDGKGNIYNVILEWEREGQKKNDEYNVCVKQNNKPECFAASYLFNWDDVPEKDNGQLIKFLRDNLEIEWTENAEIKKSKNKETITVTNKNKNSESITIKLHLTLFGDFQGKPENNKTENKVTLEITDGETHEYNLKVLKENGRLNIYTVSTASSGFATPTTPIIYEEVLKKLCIHHHLCMTMRHCIPHIIESSRYTWLYIKRYIDVRTALYREGVSLLRGIINEIAEYTDMFSDVWGMDVPDEPRIDKLVLQENNTEIKVDTNRMHDEIYQHSRTLADFMDECDGYLTDNINLRLTDDMRSAQLALRIIQPIFFMGVVLSMLSIVLRIMGIDIFGVLQAPQYVFMFAEGSLKLTIIMLALMSSAFWITLNAITYARAFELTIGLARKQDDTRKDIFFYIMSIGFIFIAIGLLINKFESTELISTLAIILLGVVLMMYFLLVSFSKNKKEVEGKEEFFDWINTGCIMVLSLFTCLFLNGSFEAVSQLTSDYQILLGFFLFMIWLFFVKFLGKIMYYNISTREDDAWEKFREILRKKFYEKVKEYVSEMRKKGTSRTELIKKDPYGSRERGKDWKYGKVFLRFKKEFMKGYIAKEAIRMLTYSTFGVLTIVITFNIAFLLNKEYFSMLFISAVVSLMATMMETNKLKYLEKKDIKMYDIFVLVATIVADIHFLIALLLYNSSPEISLAMASGAFIANIAALIFLTKENINKEEKEIEFSID